MFYISTAYGFYAGLGASKVYVTDLRKAKSFETFDQADLVAKCALARATQQYYCIVKPA